MSLTPLPSTYYDDVSLRPLIHSFANKLPTRHKAMEAAFTAKKWPDLSTLAHQLKGAAGGYGFPSISEAAARIEDCCRKNPAPHEIEKLLNDLRDLCHRAALAHPPQTLD